MPLIAQEKELWETEVLPRHIDKFPTVGTDESLHNANEVMAVDEKTQGLC